MINKTPGGNSYHAPRHPNQKQDQCSPKDESQIKMKRLNPKRKTLTYLKNLRSPKDDCVLLLVMFTPLPPQFTALYYNVNTCPRMLALAWTIFSLGLKPSAINRYVIRPDGYTAEPFPGNRQNLKTVLEQLDADVNEHRPRMINTVNDSFELTVLANEFARIGFMPTWLPIPENTRSLCTLNRHPRN